MIKKLKKIVLVIQRKVIQYSMYVDTGLYMRQYVNFLKKKGMDIKGMPNYISNDVHFDGKDYSIIHLGDGCTISREVHFLTHDYSMHTVLQGLEAQLSVNARKTLENRDVKNKLLDLRGIHIGDHTFIGARALLLPGTHLGNNCIVGGGAVVKGYYGDNIILIGNPATIYHLSTSEWLERNANRIQKGVKKND